MVKIGLITWIAGAQRPGPSTTLPTVAPLREEAGGGDAGGGRPTGIICGASVAPCRGPAAGTLRARREIR